MDDSLCCCFQFSAFKAVHSQRLDNATLPATKTKHRSISFHPCKLVPGIEMEMLNTPCQRGIAPLLLQNRPISSSGSLSSCSHNCRLSGMASKIYGTTKRGIAILFKLKQVTLFVSCLSEPCNYESGRLEIDDP
jgi:hypothetical protein